MRFSAALDVAGLPETRRVPISKILHSAGTEWLTPNGFQNRTNSQIVLVDRLLEPSHQMYFTRNKERLLTCIDPAISEDLVAVSCR